MAKFVDGVEHFCDARRSFFHNMSGQLFHFSSGSTRSRIKLANVDDWELVLLDKPNCLVKLFCCFTRKPADDISRHSQIWNVLQQIVADLLEVSQSILSVHAF
jgi:hypothetical protein